jgi:hypothetical protein
MEMYVLNEKAVGLVRWLSVIGYLGSQLRKLAFLLRSGTVSAVSPHRQLW